MIKLSVLKIRLSVGHPNISVISGILSVVGIPPVHIPILEEIQLLMFVYILILIKQYLNMKFKRQVNKPL
jgi:hypothetical protein